MTDLTREQAREQIARALAAGAGFPALSIVCRADADAALTVLWPVVESLRAERDEARGQRDATMIAAAENAPTAQTSRHLLGQLEACARELNGAFDLLAKVEDEVARLTAELAHAHTVIARHVEPLRKPCRPEAGDCCDGSAHTWRPSEGSRLPDRVDENTPSDALCGDLTDFPCCSGGSGRVDETERPR